MIGLEMKQYLINLLVAALAVLAPIQSIMIVVGVLLAADFVTGILKAFKLKETISSRAMARSIYKMLAYQLLIITGFLLEKYLIQDVIPVTKLLAATIGLVEFKSIAENVNILTGLSIKVITDRLQKRD